MKENQDPQVMEQPCQYCDGSGNDPQPRFGHHPTCNGSCTGLCPVPSQVQCRYCGGLGSVDIDPAMDEWIKELEENSISKRQTTHIDGDLSNDAPHISYWKKWEPNIHLGGYFTIIQLGALINHMKKYNEKH